MSLKVIHKRLKNHPFYNFRNSKKQNVQGVDEADPNGDNGGMAKTFSESVSQAISGVKFGSDRILQSGVHKELQLGLQAGLQKGLKKGLRSLTSAQSLVYSAESLLLPAIDFAVNRRRPRTVFDDRDFFSFARSSIRTLLDDDLNRIERGIYPASVLWNGLEPREQIESVFKHCVRIPKLLSDGVRAANARKDLKTKEFIDGTIEILSEKPDYYRRNFHFQKDGYMTDDSAELYDHQVDVLFGGTADAMRRLLLAPMKEHLRSGDGSGLHILEVGAGTGRATLGLRLMYPKAKITSLDLSAAYLRKSADRLKKYDRHDYIEAAAEDMPFRDHTFDAVFSVFLYHELPLEVRKKALSEQIRVLKKNGFLGLVDSLQLGDEPRFDEALKNFPSQYHEPFYRNYIETQMAPLVIASGAEVQSEGKGFLSKFLAAQKQ